MIDLYIRKYGKRLYGLCCTLCAFRDDADDLYQETWLKVVKNINKYDDRREFEPWLTTICVNTYRNVIKKRLRNPFFDGFATNEEKDAVLEALPAEENNDYIWLHEKIDQLPDKLRITVILYYFRDMDIIKTSEVLNIPEGTVKSRLNKAKKLLKEALRDESDLQF